MSGFYAVHQLADHVMATVTPMQEGSRIIHITVQPLPGAAPLLHWGLVREGVWDVPPDHLWPAGSVPYTRQHRIEALRTPLTPAAAGGHQVRLTCPPQSTAQALAFVLYDPQHGYQHNAGRDFAVPLQAATRIHSVDGTYALRVQGIAWAPPVASGFLLPRFPLTVALWLHGTLPPPHVAPVRAAVVWEGPEGMAAELPLPAVQRHAEATVWRGTFLPPWPGQYRYRVVLHLATQAFPMGQGDVWIAEPHADEAWTQGPLLVAIAEGLFVGNAAAAANPRVPEAGGRGLLDLHGVKAVLNATEERDPAPALLGSGIAYAQFPFQDGAEHPLDEGRLWDAVHWIHQHRQRGQPVLVHCHAGRGRSGSLVLAYVLLFVSPERSFDEVVALVQERLRPHRHHVYPHVGLAASVQRLREVLVAPGSR